MKHPKYAEVEGEKYPINTSFRIAIECDCIARDKTIGEFERALAIIFKLFGNKGLQAYKHHEKLIELAQTYLCCGKKIENNSNSEPDMDYVQDMDFIEASFMSDYGIDIATEDMHWWKFNNLINGLSNSELGNCCILNRVRNLRTFDATKIKDSAERKKIEEAKKVFALKKPKEPIDYKQAEEILNIYEKLGIRRR